jgi:hypothetical protein
VFTELDVNGDGNVSRSELLGGLKSKSGYSPLKKNFPKHVKEVRMCLMLVPT